MGFLRDRDELDEANGFGAEIDSTDPFAWVYGIPEQHTEAKMVDHDMKVFRHEPIIKLKEEA